MKRATILLAILFSVFSGKAQEDSVQTSPKLIWSLEDCINYVMDNSLEVQQKLVDVYYNELQLKQAKWDRAGTLSASMDGGRNIGRTITRSNVYVDGGAWQVSSGASYGINLFNGFRLNNLQKMREKSLAATEKDLQAIKEDIALQVTFAYLDAIYAKEVVKVANAQILVSKDELSRINLKYEAGEASKDQFLEGQAQLAREESNLADAEADVSYNLLLLSQLLNMDFVSGFDIIIPATEDVKAQISLLSAREVYNIAVETRPELKAAEYRIHMEEDNLKATKANYYPSLGFGANYNTDFNDQNYYFEPNDEGIPVPTTMIPFTEQILNNRRAFLGLRLSIPIFDGMRVRNNVKAQELAIENRELELDMAKRQFRETVQRAYNEALSAHKKYIAAQKVAEASKASFDFAQQKFSYGAMSVFDFNTSKNNLTKADVELLQAKYKFIFSTKVLDFYRGIPLSL